MALAGPYVSHLHLAANRLPPKHLITQFGKGRNLFLTPNKQCKTLVANSQDLQTLAIPLRLKKYLKPEAKDVSPNINRTQAEGRKMPFLSLTALTFDL